MEASASLRKHIQELEEQLLQPAVRRSRQALDELLANEFTEFASDGVAYSKDQVIDALERETLHLRSLTDFHVVALAETVIFTTYRASRKNATSNESIDSLRSSIWTQRDGRWQLLFHQGTTRAAP
jgi:hypothetical protein